MPTCPVPILGSGSNRLAENEGGIRGSGFMDTIISFAQDNKVIAIAIAVILIFLIYRKPKLFLGILFIGFVLAVVFYLVTSIAGSGSKQKTRLLLDGEKQSDVGR